VGTFLGFSIRLLLYLLFNFYWVLVLMSYHQVLGCGVFVQFLMVVVFEALRIIFALQLELPSKCSSELILV